MRGPPCCRSFTQRKAEYRHKKGIIGFAEKWLRLYVSRVITRWDMWEQFFLCHLQVDPIPKTMSIRIYEVWIDFSVWECCCRAIILKQCVPIRWIETPIIRAQFFSSSPSMIFCFSIKYLQEVGYREICDPGPHFGWMQVILSYNKVRKDLQITLLLVSWLLANWTLWINAYPL